MFTAGIVVDFPPIFFLSPLPFLSVHVHFSSMTTFHGGLAPVRINIL